MKNYSFRNFYYISNKKLMQLTGKLPQVKTRGRQVIELINQEGEILMRTKKDIEKAQDSISPEIIPGMPQLIARSQKSSSIISYQEAQSLSDINAENKSFDS
jgi:hypothetical protein